MVVLWICLWTIAAIIFFTDPKNDTTRWCSAIAFFGGFGGLSVFTEDTLAPYIRSQIHGEIPGIEFMLNALDGVSASFGHYLGPLSVLMFGLHYTKSPLFDRFSKKKVTIAALIPVLLMYVLFPVYPRFRTDFALLTIWAGPYILLANIMLVFSWMKEQHIRLKKQKLLTCLIVVPTTLFSLMTNFVLRVYGIEQMWRYNTLVIVVAFVAFFYFCVKYSFLGIKLRFEKDRLDSTMRAVTSGATTLNHTFKNEIGKIHILADRIHYKAEQDNQIEIKNDAGLVLESADHMLGMMTRIQNKLQEIVLDERAQAIPCIVERALASLHPYIEKKGIEVIRNYSAHAKLVCDEVHLQEILCNVCKNAIDAMSSGGRLHVEVENSKREFIIAIKDNGCGISKENLAKVIDPFFTTKSRKTNYGLGLSYCYNVMQKHGGTLELQSELQQGTSVTLHFPKNKVITTADDDFQVEVSDGKNQSAVG